MNTYEQFRAFADSWGMLAMLLFFAGTVVMVFLPGAKKRAQTRRRSPGRRIET